MAEASGAVAGELQPPDEFPFPFPPYSVQKDFMRQLWTTVERGHLGRTPTRSLCRAASLALLGLTQTLATVCGTTSDDVGVTSPTWRWMIFLS